MGLFDSYYDQPSGGMIDRILAQLAQNQPAPSQLTDAQRYPGLMPSDTAQYGSTPSAQPTLAMAQAPVMPQRNAQPSPLDNAQWPYGPNGAPSQANAQAYAPQPAPQMQAPQAAPQAQQGIPAAFLAPSGGGPAGFVRGLGENLHNGLINGLIGGIAGANGQGAGDIHNQQLRAQYQALLDAGIPQQKALLATINPEAGKLILADALGKEKYQHVAVKNMDGSETPQAFNPATGQYSGAAPPPAGSGGLGNMDLTGKEYLASLPKSEANIVQQMVDGTIAPPSSFALGKPIWANRIAAAKNYDPSFDATNWSGRVAGVKDFSAGKSSEMVRSANQTLHHAGQLLTSMDDLNNGSYPALNYLGNKANEAVGGGAPTAFRLNAHAVAEEMSKVFKGANLSDTEIKAWEQNLNENMSPEQQRAAVGKLRDLLQGSLQALDEKRVSSMGQMAADKAGPIIKPEGQAVLQRIDAWLKKGTGAAQGTTPAQTKTGVNWSVEK